MFMSELDTSEESRKNRFIRVRHKLGCLIGGFSLLAVESDAPASGMESKRAAEEPVAVAAVESSETHPVLQRILARMGLISPLDEDALNFEIPEPTISGYDVSLPTQEEIDNPPPITQAQAEDHRIALAASNAGRPPLPPLEG